MVTKRLIKLATKALAVGLKTLWDRYKITLGFDTVDGDHNTDFRQFDSFLLPVCSW